jgi:hypothetical protein
MLFSKVKMQILHRLLPSRYPFPEVINDGLFKNYFCMPKHLANVPEAQNVGRKQDFNHIDSVPSGTGYQ